MIGLLFGEMPVDDLFIRRLTDEKVGEILALFGCDEVIKIERNPEYDLIYVEGYVTNDDNQLEKENYSIRDFKVEPGSWANSKLLRELTQEYWDKMEDWFGSEYRDALHREAIHTYLQHI